MHPGSHTSLLTAVAIVVLGAVLVAGQTAPSAQEIAQSIQRKYDTIRDFSTDFVQTHEGGVLKRKRVERGTLLVKKPGKMRWNYQAPDEKVFVSDGVRLIQFFPDENRAIVSGVPTDDQAAAVLFLTGRGNLARDFNVSMGSATDASAWTLRLEPKQEQADYDWIELTTSRNGVVLQSLSVAEKQGSRSTFVFSNFKENPGLADKTFAFSIPRGAEVKSAEPVKR